MNLVRDLLDIQVRDSRYRRCGRVDGIVLEVRAGAPPRVAWLELGGTTYARRIHPKLMALYTRLAKWFGFDPTPVRIPMKQVGKIDLSLTLAIDAGTHPELLEAEERLARLVRRGAA